MCTLPLLLSSSPCHMIPIVAYQMIYTVHVDILNWFGDGWPLSCFLPMHKYLVLSLSVTDAQCSAADLLPCVYAVVIAADNCYFPAFPAGWPGRCWAKGKSCLCLWKGEARCYPHFKGWYFFFMSGSSWDDICFNGFLFPWTSCFSKTIFQFNLPSSFCPL